MNIDPNEQFAYLTSTGRKSGHAREIEIWYVTLEDRIYILAEHGLRAHWVQNIIADPVVGIRIGDRKWTAVGKVLDAARDRALFEAARRAETLKYGWGDGLPVEFTLTSKSDD